jgi:transcriptional regulator with XRE-family HTH domain
MSTIQSRLVELRDELGIKQNEFAKKIGLTNSAVSMIESGRNPLTESNIKLICSMFGVRENWLRTGQGSMFISNSLITNDIISKFEQLSPELQNRIISYMDGLIDAQETIQNMEDKTQSKFSENKSALQAKKDVSNTNNVSNVNAEAV